MKVDGFITPSVSFCRALFTFDCDHIRSVIAPKRAVAVAQGTVTAQEEFRFLSNGYTNGLTMAGSFQCSIPVYIICGLVLSLRNDQKKPTESNPINKAVGFYL